MWTRTSADGEGDVSVFAMKIEALITFFAVETRRAGS
jgi:hypothetical protein